MQGDLIVSEGLWPEEQGEVGRRVRDEEAVLSSGHSHLSKGAFATSVLQTPPSFLDQGMTSETIIMLGTFVFELNRVGM